VAQESSRSRNARLLGRTEETVGVLGIIVCIALIVGVVFTWTRVTDAINNAETSFQNAVGQGNALVDRASAVVGEVNDRVTSVEATAAQMAANPDKGPSLGPVLLGEIEALSSRYADLRTAYLNFHNTATNAISRIDAISKIVPGFTFPETASAALASLDSRMQAFDAQVTEIINSNPAQVIAGALAAPIEALAKQVQGGIAEVQSALDSAKARLDQASGNVSSSADTARLGANVVTITLVLLLLYLVALHFVLLRTGMDLRARARAESAAAAPFAPSEPSQQAASTTNTAVATPGPVTATEAAVTSGEVATTDEGAGDPATNPADGSSAL
jgi:hypothetical protein